MEKALTPDCMERFCNNRRDDSIRLRISNCGSICTTLKNVAYPFEVMEFKRQINNFSPSSKPSLTNNMASPLPPVLQQTVRRMWKLAQALCWWEACVPPTLFCSMKALSCLFHSAMSRELSNPFGLDMDPLLWRSTWMPREEDLKESFWRMGLLQKAPFSTKTIPSPIVVRWSTTNTTASEYPFLKTSLVVVFISSGSFMKARPME